MASLSQVLSRPIKVSLSPSRFHFSHRNWNMLNVPFPISCASKDGQNCDNGELNLNSVEMPLNRRNILIGLSSSTVCSVTSASILERNHNAQAAPITLSDLSNCSLSELPIGAISTNCCPPYTDDMLITDFVVPNSNKSDFTLRVRPAAHLVDDTYVTKFSKAVLLMKALPPNDPHNFMQQANVHCAYCDSAYIQAGFPDMELQIHGSWFFFPWHRCYIFFFERMLANLIDDENFAMPFWNWDAPQGMTMPEIYVSDTSSPLYDPLRAQQHQPPVIIDLNFGGCYETTLTDEQLINQNLNVMYRQVISNSTTGRLFYGYPYRAGDSPDPGAGALELIPHNPVHLWTGDPNQPNRENMGTFYSASRDPIFFAHHSNIDRIWNIWKSLGGKHNDFTDPDWLNASFLFYDETAKLIRIKVEDCLNSIQLRYKYQDVDIHWLNSRPAVTQGLGKSSKTLSQLPIELQSAVCFQVNRPSAARTEHDKEEVLMIEGIELECKTFAKFDVYVNVGDDEFDKVGAGGREFAGSFVNVAHGSNKGMKSTRLQLCLTEMLKDLKIESDENVMVTLVPISTGKVKIGSMKIELTDC